MPAQRRWISILIAGDFIAILALSVLGFAFHNQALTPRLLSTLLPSLAGWALIAPWLGAYRMESASKPAHAWRAALAGLLAAPLIAFLRGLWLNAAIPPIFILVLALTTAFGMGVWRAAWGWYAARTLRYG